MANSEKEVELQSRTITQLRGLAILGVVAIHATGPWLSSPLIKQPAIYSLILINQLSRFCVPMFFFITGYLYARKYDGPFDYARFLRQRFFSIGIPYLLWSSLYMMIRMMEGYSSYVGLNGLSILECYMKGSASGHLYFISALFQFYLCLPIIIGFWRMVRSVVNPTVLMSFCFGLFLMIYQWRITSLDTGAGPFLLSSDYLIVWWFPFIFLGFEWGRQSWAGRGWGIQWIAVILAIAFFLMNFECFFQYNQWSYYYSTFMTHVDCGAIATFLRPTAFIFAFFSIPMLTYLIQNQGIYLNLFDILGKYSFGIYLCHPLVNKCIKTLICLSGYQYTTALYTPWIYLVVGTGLTALLVHIMSKIRGMHWVFGTTR